jgi:hypothetical protein
VSEVPVDHPSWCNRRLCTVGVDPRSGFHLSRLAILDPDPGTDLGVTIQIGQGTPISGYAKSDLILVDLTVYQQALDDTDTAEEYTLTLAAQRAEILGRMLVSAGREAVRSACQQVG